MLVWMLQWMLVWMLVWLLAAATRFDLERYRVEQNVAWVLKGRMVFGATVFAIDR